MRRFHPLEGFTIIFLGIMLLLIILFYPRFPHGWKLLRFVPLVLLALAIAESRTRWGNVRAVRILCDFSPIFFVIAIYELLGGIIPYLRPEVDDLLIKIDQTLCGIQPTIWLERFLVPWLTDILAVAYASYYFIPAVLITILYFRGKEEEFSMTICTLLLGYYISFVGYITMPTIGPRFTLTSVYNVPLQWGQYRNPLSLSLTPSKETGWIVFPAATPR